jgi:hypothetical protein
MFSLPCSVVRTVSFSRLACSPMSSDRYPWFC